MKVYLHNVGYNLNRVYRLCHGFRVESIVFVGYSDDRSIKKEKIKVPHQYMEDIEMYDNAIFAFGQGYETNIYDADWSGCKGILIGNEKTGLPIDKIGGCKKISIPTRDHCISVEAALAIGLSEWHRSMLQKTVT